MSNDKSYRIVRLTAENIKRLVAVDIQPDGNMVEITGRNGAGKTSVLDAIWWALAGTKNVQGKPIRDGEEQAVIELSLGSLIVTRTFTAKEDGGYTTKLLVQNEDGAKYGSPQSILDAIVGDLTFDPLHFTRQKPVDQLKILREFVTDFDFQDAAQRRKGLYDDRTDANRDVKNLKSRIDAIPEPSDGEIIDLDKAMSAYEEAMKRSREVSERNAKITKAISDQAHHETQIAVIDNEIIDLQAKISSLQSQRGTHNDQIIGLKRISQRDHAEDVDLMPFKADLDTARSQSELVSQQKERERLQAEFEEAQRSSEELSAKIEALDAEQATAVLNSDMPVDGISFSDDHILLNDIPFSQASDAQQLRAAIEIAIAMNPQLRICRVRDGSLIDKDGMKALAEYAEKHDFQIWIERVDQSGKSGIVIENGQINSEA